jgi:hypothetical protein
MSIVGAGPASLCVPVCSQCSACGLAFELAYVAVFVGVWRRLLQGVIFGFKKNADTLLFDAAMSLVSPASGPPVTRFGSQVMLSDSFVLCGIPSHDSGNVRGRRVCILDHLLAPGCP